MCRPYRDAPISGTKRHGGIVFRFTGATLFLEKGTEKVFVVLSSFLSLRLPKSNNVQSLPPFE